MPNEVIDVIHSAEEFFTNESEKIKSAIHDEFVAIEPQLLALGRTILSQVFQAAIVYVVSGGPANPAAAAAAIASIVSQLPADKLAIQHLIAAAFAGAVENLIRKQVAGEPVQ